MNPGDHAASQPVAATPVSIKRRFGETAQVRGLLPLLMKTRGWRRWTVEERAAMRSHLRKLSNVSPYLIVLALPGSFLILPALVWWRERRRSHHRRAAPASTTK